MIRSVLYWIVLAVVAATAGFFVYQKYEDTRPCVQTIHYAIGAVDARFGISNSALIADAEVAAKIWNKAAGKSVLAYDPKAELKINLIYDEREANAKLGSQITRLQESSDNERVTLDARQAEYTAQLETYNQAVQAVNARGGANKSEAATLNRQHDELNSLASSIKSDVASYNASVVSLNALVAEFNKSAGRTFEQGQYVRDAEGERINIFEFIGTTQLERVLAHEFGHALDLDHNDDPKSIMFAKNESGNLIPTSADLSALKAICGN